MLLEFDGRLRPAIKVLTDYPRDDLAHDEVRQALLGACVRHGIETLDIDVGAIPSLDTVVAGFKTAQLALNSSLGFGHIFHTNCAPRKNIVSVKSLGEKIVLGMTENGAALLLVNSGYTLAPFAELAKEGRICFFQTSVPDSGSQFRSRDFFPEAVAMLAAHLAMRSKKLGSAKIRQLIAKKEFGVILQGLSYLGKPLSDAAFPHLPEGSVYYVDNFGNIKLNYRHRSLLKTYKAGTVLVLRLGQTVSDAVVGDEGFSQGEGVIALTAGSSGWTDKAGEKEFFTEIFLRGGRAASHFGDLKPGDRVLAVEKQDLEKVIGVLRKADTATSEKFDLYNVSEQRIIEILGRSGLVRDGFDSSELRKALKKGDLLKRLVAAHA